MSHNICWTSYVIKDCILDSRRTKRHGSAGAKQNKEAMKIICGDWTVLFPDIPTSISFYLSASVHGMQ